MYATDGSIAKHSQRHETIGQREIQFYTVVLKILQKIESCLLPTHLANNQHSIVFSPLWSFRASNATDSLDFGTTLEAQIHSKMAELSLPFRSRLRTRKQAATFFPAGKAFHQGQQRAGFSRVVKVLAPSAPTAASYAGPIDSADESAPRNHPQKVALPACGLSADR